MGYIKAIKRAKRRRSEELLGVIITGTRGSKDSIAEFYDKQD